MKKILLSLLLSIAAFAAGNFVYNTPISDVSLNASLGKVNGQEVIHKFGRNPDIDMASGFETLWNGGGIYTGFDATEAQNVLVSSDSADDTLAGTGARTIRIFGLNENYLQIQEDLNLTGLTDVNTTNQYIR